MRMFLKTLTLAALAAALTPTLAMADNSAWVPPAPDGTISFNMPSGNVGCTYVPPGGTGTYRTATGGAELHCTIEQPNYRVVILQPAGPAPAPFATAEVGGLPLAAGLPYGRFWQAGPFTCLSARSGLMCTNATGNGLRMARRGVETW
jgi:hypothetical protein